MTTETSILACKFIGMVDGARIYRERRGVNHVQHPTRPARASFTGTIREIERASHSSFVKS